MAPGAGKYLSVLSQTASRSVWVFDSGASDFFRLYSLRFLYEHILRLSGHATILQHESDGL